MARLCSSSAPLRSRQRAQRLRKKTHTYWLRRDRLRFPCPWSLLEDYCSPAVGASCALPLFSSLVVHRGNGWSWLCAGLAIPTLLAHFAMPPPPISLIAQLADRNHLYCSTSTRPASHLTIYPCTTIANSHHRLPHPVGFIPPRSRTSWSRCLAPSNGFFVVVSKHSAHSINVEKRLFSCSSLREWSCVGRAAVRRRNEVRSTDGSKIVLSSGRTIRCSVVDLRHCSDSF